MVKVFEVFSPKLAMVPQNQLHVSPHIKEKISEGANIVRLTKQYGTFLVLLPALWSLTLAGQGKLRPWMVLVFASGAFLMRSAGCVINDIADRNFDGHVERTKNRPLPAGTITLKEAIIIFALLVFLSACLAFVLNPLSIFLSFIALILALVYPFTKRFFNVPQCFLGLAFGWGAIIAWAAVRGTLELPAWIIFFSTVFWTMGYDTIYALLDRKDDLKIGIKSSAILFGEYTWQAVAVLFTVTVALLIIVGWLSGLGLLYYFSVAIVLILFARQVYDIKQIINPQRIFATYKSNGFVAIIILMGIFGGYFYK